MNNETIAKRIAETTAPPSVIDAVSALIAEKTRLEYQNHRMGMEIAENSIRFLVFNKVVAERDKLRAENERLNEAIDEFLHNWTDDAAGDAMRNLLDGN